VLRKRPDGCDHSSRVVTAGIILALLYLGRSVLIPLALAIMLSLSVAPVQGSEQEGIALV
jgi:predicted PurR-regulated permease PerM